MMTVHRNKMSLKVQAEDIVVDWSDDIINFLNENDPKHWHKIINELQKTFVASSESILEKMYDEKGWND